MPEFYLHTRVLLSASYAYPYMNSLIEQRLHVWMMDYIGRKTSFQEIQTSIYRIYGIYRIHRDMHRQEEMSIYIYMYMIGGYPWHPVNDSFTLC